MAYVFVPPYNRRDHVVGWAKIDAADAPLVCGHRWHRTYYGYAMTGSPSKGTNVLMHRMVLGLGKGDPRQSDHRYGDRLDNRRSRLRIVTNAQNAQNMAARAGTSRHRGVSRRRDTGRWTGYVKVAGRRYGAGCHATEAEAVAATRALRARLMPYDEPSRHA